MSKWLNLFLENEIVNRSDKSDRFRFETNMSPLSLRSQGLLDEKMEKMENNPRKGGDKSDRFRFESNMSPLSLRTPELLDEKMENNLRKGGDKSDRFRFEPNMSPLSLRTRGLLDEKLINTPEPDISDNPDKFDPHMNMSDLSGRPQDVLERTSYPYSSQDFEERLAIAEYDGGQTSLHAHPIAYLDAFISTLTALPATASQRNWLNMRIQTALDWIESQNFHTLN